MIGPGIMYLFSPVESTFWATPNGFTVTFGDVFFVTIGTLNPFSKNGDVSEEMPERETKCDANHKNNYRHYIPKNQIIFHK